MSYVAISSVRGERRIKLHKAGANALMNAIDVLETIKDNLSSQSPLGGDGGPIEQAVMAMKATIVSFQVDHPVSKRKPDAPGQGMLFNEGPDATDPATDNSMEMIGNLKVVGKI